MRIKAALKGLFLDLSTNKVPIAGLRPMQIINTALYLSAHSKQRLLDIRNNACLKCHKPGCWPQNSRSNDHCDARVSTIEVSLTN